MTIRDVAMTVFVPDTPGASPALAIRAARISIDLATIDAVAPLFLARLDRVANEKIGGFLDGLPLRARALKQLVGLMRTAGAFGVRCEAVEEGIRVTIEELPERAKYPFGGSMVIGLAVTERGRLRVRIGDVRLRVAGKNLPAVPSSLFIDTLLKVAPNQSGLYPVGKGSVEIDVAELLAAKSESITLAARVRTVSVTDGVLHLRLG